MFGYFILAVVGYVALGISVGQFASMFLRSGFLAGFFSVLLTSLLAGWCGLMWWWHVSWLWSVLPIPLALLLATRLRTRDWLLERKYAAGVVAAGARIDGPAGDDLDGRPALPRLQCSRDRPRLLAGRI